MSFLTINLTNLTNLTSVFFMFFSIFLVNDANKFDLMFRIQLRVRSLVRDFGWGRVVMGDLQYVLRRFILNMSCPQGCDP